MVHFGSQVTHDNRDQSRSNFKTTRVMDQETLFVGLVTLLLVLLILPILFPSYPDTSPWFLNNQSSIAGLRREDETAVYRSLLTPHGQRLISGLCIDQSSGTNRDGIFDDLWKLAANAELASCIGGERNSNTLSYLKSSELKRLVNGIGKELSSWLKTAEARTPNVVAVLLPNCIEACIVTFASILYNLPVVYIQVDELAPEKLEALIHEIEPHILISEGSILQSIGLEGYESLAGVLSVKGEVNTSLPINKTWKQVCDECETTIGSFPEFKLSESSSIVFSLAYKDAATGSLRFSHFTNQNLVSSIASQIKSLPQSQKWQKSDIILSCTSSLSMYTLVLNLTALVLGATLVFPEGASINLLKMVSEVKPTILITDDDTCWSLASRSEFLTVIEMFKFRHAWKQLTKSRMPKRFVALNEFRSVRLIHTSYNAAQQMSELQTNKDLNEIKAMTGARIVHALSSPMSLSPIVQTSMYDHRLGDSGLTNFGAPLPCLEIKLRSHKEVRADNRQGQLWIRGYSLPGDDEWINTAIMAQLGQDGCLRLCSDED